jgi:hypothetical protein
VTQLNSISNDNLSHLLGILSYTLENGWISANDFDSIHAHRFALAQAKESMHVAGVFCWLDRSQTSIAAPLVYISIVSDRDEAQSIHRKVWSQGLVPFLILLTPTEVLICDGFTYKRENWEQSLKCIPLCDLIQDKNVKTDKLDIATLNDLHATRLRSSLFWRDHAINVAGRVDQCLLDGLDALSWNLKNGTNTSLPLPYTAANGLIGKLLYVFFLSDRGIINREWLQDRGHSDIDLYDRRCPLSKQSLWILLDDLDSIFNGSVFPLSHNDRSYIDDTHIDLVRMVMKHGTITTHQGTMQLSLLDIDLGVLRVETLSAVYEQFLENVENGERRKVGAYYTPPFLVDLILDRVEEACPLSDGVRVLDPSAGSGVFLVGAYRRILEHARASHANELSLEHVRELLTRNIFGVERNPDACHVAAFSLYLTMLDYVNPRDLTRVAEGKDPKKLFPCLVGNNLFAKDFFDEFSSSPFPKIHCVVGNPPWQSLKKLESSHAIQWLHNHSESPIGNDQAAELFIWKSLREHMADDGVLAMLIPAKSFVNPTSAKFRKQLSTDFSVFGAMNFAHLRHRLFIGAKHACAGIFVRNSKSSRDAFTWVYSPLSISQPIASREEWPWTLMMDRSDIQLFRQDFFQENARAWFEAFMLRPVDRQIQRYIVDAARSNNVDAGRKKISMLGALCKTIDAVIKRGGNSSDTGLDEKYLTDDFPLHTVSGNTKGATLDLFPEIQDALSIKKTNKLPVSQLEKVKTTYRNQFSGNILLVPRNFRDIRFVDYPKAYTSSYLAVFFNKDGAQVTAKEKKFLRGLEKYLHSSTALYFMATTGRRWLMDRRNVEPADFSALPIPLSSLDDERIDGLLSRDGAELETYIQKAMGLNGDLKKAIAEFLQFRMLFQDGNVPSNALEMPPQAMLVNYSKVMQRCLDGLVGRKGAFRVIHQVDAGAGIAVVTAQFLEDDSILDDVELSKACKKAVESYHTLGTNSFSDSLAVVFKKDTDTAYLTKPLEYFRWTIDSAYTDSRSAMAAFVKG